MAELSSRPTRLRDVLENGAKAAQSNSSYPRMVLAVREAVRAGTRHLLTDELVKMAVEATAMLKALFDELEVKDEWQLGAFTYGFLFLKCILRREFRAPPLITK